MLSILACHTFLNTFKNSETLIAYNLDTTQAIFKIQRPTFSEFDPLFTGRTIYICPYTFRCSRSSGGLFNCFHMNLLQLAKLLLMDSNIHTFS